MIRYAQKGDYEQILALWDMCFGEDKVFNEWFFKNRFKLSETAVYEADGKIASMLQIMPYEIKGIGKTGYIYGACTDKAYRNRGYMAQLLAFAERLYEQTILIPQEKCLFGFYEKLGYRPCTFIDIADLQGSGADAEIRPAQLEDIDGIKNIYEKQFEHFIVRDYDYWAAQINMFRETGGEVYCMEKDGKINAYAFVWNNGFIQEMFPQNENFAKKIGEVLGKNIRCSVKGENPFACIKGRNDDIYINLMFN